MKKLILTTLLFTSSQFLFSCGEAIDVARQEFGPKESLRKYEWFKDASATLEEKIANLKVYEARFKDLEESYKGVLRQDWARSDREQWSLWKSEAAGVEASYNALAAEYNAQSSKFNWAYAQGDIPQEYAQYSK